MAIFMADRLELEAGYVVQHPSSPVLYRVLEVVPGSYAVLVPDSGAPKHIKVDGDGRQILGPNEERYLFVGIDLRNEVNGIRVGDTVRARGCGRKGEVVALSGNGWLRVKWPDDRTNIRALDVNLVDLGPSTEVPEPTPEFRVGDRVRHNRKVDESHRRLGGVVQSMSTSSQTVYVKWDGDYGKREELMVQLELVYRDGLTDQTPAGVRKAVKILDAESERIEEQVDKLQAQLRAIKEAKSILLEEV